MRKMKEIIVIIGILILGACTEEETLYQEEIGQRKSTITHKTAKNNPLAPEIVKDQIVIQFKQKNLTYEEKFLIQQSLENKYYFKVIGEPETCNCDDDSIELWTIDISHPLFGGIEDLVTKLKNEDGEGGVEGDHQFWLYVQDHRINLGEKLPIKEWVVDTNVPDAVTVGVLDTGVAYDLFEEPFLYNSSHPDNCESSEISGWDFVNKDYDIIDDHGHGTAVSKIIKETLDRENVLHHILPVKVFDNEGKGTYFNVVCGLQYLAKKNISMTVNASFGFYALKNQQIFKNILLEASDRLFLVTSSGNKGVNTDLGDSEHFPSGYDLMNMIAVGGYTGDFLTAPYYGIQAVSGFSLDLRANFGGTNVDVAAQFSHELTFNGRPFTFEGTSYSSAKVTARAAAVHYKQFTFPRDLKRAILETAFTSYSFNGKISNNKILVSGYYRTPPILQPYQR